MIEAELRALRSEPWEHFVSRRTTFGTSERVVEVPWVLSRYQQERTVLDIGAAFALELYRKHLRSMGIPALHGVDLQPVRLNGLAMTAGDARALPYKDGCFDLILCVSTLEHIGADTEDYGASASRSKDGDVEALIEIRRVLAPRGRLLITVPFGVARDYGWFRQYDFAGWTELLSRAALQSIETAFYAHSQQGWHKERDPRRLSTATYRADGASGASAVLCATLTRSDAAAVEKQ